MSLYLTRRVLIDIRKIQAGSVEKYGERVVHRYWKEFEESLETIEAHPGLLLKRHFSKALRFYFSGKHALICVVIDSDVYVTAIWYGGIDLEHTVPEFEPTLLEEASILYEKLKKAVRK